MRRETPALLFATLAIWACVDRADPPVTELTIDTLGDGSVRVSKPQHGLWAANADSR